MLPNSIFKSRDPIVAGVAVEAGIIRPGTPLCVPSREVKSKLTVLSYATTREHFFRRQKPIILIIYYYFLNSFATQEYAPVFSETTVRLRVLEKVKKFASKQSQYRAKHQKCLVGISMIRIWLLVRYAVKIYCRIFQGDAMINNVQVDISCKASLNKLHLYFRYRELRLTLAKTTSETTYRKRIGS